MVAVPHELTAGFSGVVSVERGDEILLREAYGLAHRAFRVANTVDTRFGIASGTKGLTALAVLALVERGALGLDTTARSVLGADLPLVDGRVTVEQLLAHRAGVGDHVDEDGDINDYVLPVPVHTLVGTEDYLAVLAGRSAVFAPGERFSYCNAGYVLLALIAERVSGVPFQQLVDELVCGPAGMRDTGFFRSDELPERTAVGYVDEVRCNVLHLPVLGSGDGGIYSTVADVGRFWRALFAGAIVPVGRVAEMVRPRSEVPDVSMWYGLGFWLRPTAATRTDDTSTADSSTADSSTADTRLNDGSTAVLLEGYDVGMSFRSVHIPASGLTYTVVANTSEGAWPILRHLDEVVGP